MPRAIVDYRAIGAAVITRCQTLNLPVALKRPHSEFVSAHRAFDSAATKADAARARRDDAVKRVGQADDALDAGLEVLATCLVGAELGARTKPFARFGGKPLSALVKLPYAVEVKEARALVKKIAQAKPPKAVERAVLACQKLCDAVAQALDGLSGPQLEFDRARAARDALITEWDRALRRFKRHAAVAWEDEPALYASVFAAPAAEQRPVSRKRTAKQNGKQQPTNAADPA